jgi:hypothetical protein
MGGHIPSGRQCSANHSSHTSGVRESGKMANQGCRYASPLAIIRAAFQAALGTPEACQEGSLACEQGEPRQVWRFLKNRTPAGVRGLGFASVVDFIESFVCNLGTSVLKEGSLRTASTLRVSMRLQFEKAADAFNHALDLAV